MTDARRAPSWGWVAGIVGPVTFVGGAVLGATQHDGYSSANQFVSELAAKGSDARPLMTAAFLVFGVCTLLLATRMRQLWPTAVALTIAVTASGVGTFFAGVFSCDMGCPTEGGDRSTSQQLHDVTSVVTFLAWAAALAIAAWQFRRTTYGKRSLALAVVDIGAMTWIATQYMPREPGDPVGVVQRIALLAVTLWFVVTALELRSPAPPAEPP